MVRHETDTPFLTQLEAMFSRTKGTVWLTMKRIEEKVDGKEVPKCQIRCQGSKDKDKISRSIAAPKIAIYQDRLGKVLKTPSLKSTRKTDAQVKAKAKATAKAGGGQAKLQAKSRVKDTNMS